MKLLLFLVLFCLIQFVVLSKPDESPGFFLKVTKNIPRLGRRSDPELISYSQKSQFGNHGLNKWFIDLIKPLKTSKRRLRPVTSDAFEYNMVQPVDSVTLIELLRHDALPPQSVRFVHWKDFDVALQRDSDLYSKVISLGRAPDVDLRANLNLNKYRENFGVNQDVDNDLYGDELIYEK